MIAHLARFTFSVLALVAFAGSAQALQFAELSLDDCDSMGCEGSTLYLSVQEEVGGSWLVTYTINTDAYTGTKAGFNQIGFKAIDNWTTGSVLTSPGGLPSDPLPTFVYDDPIASNSLCDTSNGDTDKVCIFGYVNIQGGGDYTWTFRIDDGALITDTSQWYFGAQYADGAYRSAGNLISTKGGTPPTPEPTAALLFGLGALLVTRSVRHR